MTSKLSSPSLPPCRVCGEAATGFHYGVNTCGGCKGFFGRNLMRSDALECVGKGQCEVVAQGKRKRVCQKCRFEKCLRVGMSKDAIKTGRYSYIKKTQDTLELQKHLAKSGKEAQDMDFVLLGSTKNGTPNSFNKSETSRSSDSSPVDTAATTDKYVNSNEMHDVSSDQSNFMPTHGMVDNFPRNAELLSHATWSPSYLTGASQDLLAEREYSPSSLPEAITVDHETNNEYFPESHHDSEPFQPRKQFRDQHQPESDESEIYFASEKQNLYFSETPSPMAPHVVTPVGIADSDLMDFDAHHGSLWSSNPNSPFGVKTDEQGYNYPLADKLSSFLSSTSRLPQFSTSENNLAKTPSQVFGTSHVIENLTDMTHSGAQEITSNNFASMSPHNESTTVPHCFNDNFSLWVEHNSPGNCNDFLGATLDEKIDDCPLNLTSPKQKDPPDTTSGYSVDSPPVNAPFPSSRSCSLQCPPSLTSTSNALSSGSSSPSAYSPSPPQSSSSPSPCMSSILSKSVVQEKTEYNTDVEDFTSSFDTSDCSMLFSRLFVREMTELLPNVVEDGTHLSMVPVKRRNCISFLVQLKKPGVCATFYSPPTGNPDPSRAETLTVDALRSVSAKKADVPEFESDFSEEELMELIESIVESHSTHVKHDTNTIDPEELEYLLSVCHKACQSHDPEKRPHTFDFPTYCKQYKLTGADLDGRRAVYNTVTMMLETAIVKAVRFFKGIPGVKQMFTLEDQVALIKGGMYEYLMLGGFKGCDWKRRVQVDSELNHVQCEHDMGKLFPDYHVDSNFDVSKKLQKLDLKFIEIILLKAMVISSPDREFVKDHVAVGQFHWKLVNCLLLVLHRNGRTSKFPDIVDALVELQEFGHCCWKWCLLVPDLISCVRFDHRPLLTETFFNRGPKSK
ncbi:uncharacterized protein LOC101858831 [Aplysia californica]|uniref:Uncharacterized protein LOC101858831 n=1 Tax=Aplysia californica TaxID=6500 RepID=A0ABM0JD47_APLCA|nr:uncharacterized protein LOC101858831 [Aplysia californica]XP_012943815.1 uncharacterized protein LOC101858831 [Aplysia californica]